MFHAAARRDEAAARFAAQEAAGEACPSSGRTEATGSKPSRGTGLCGRPRYLGGGEREAVGMNPAQFRAWRKALGWKQKEAAERLGLKKRMIQYYETGERDGQKVKIPKSVRLACYALSQGVADFDGETARRDAPDLAAQADGKSGLAAADGAAQP